MKLGEALQLVDCEPLWLGFSFTHKLKFCAELVTNHFSINTSSIVTESWLARRKAKLELKCIILYSKFYHFDPPVFNNACT